MSNKGKTVWIVTMILIAGFIVVYKFTPASKYINQMLDVASVFLPWHADDTAAAPHDSSDKSSNTKPPTKYTAKITLKDNSSDISGSGASSNEQGITITSGGTYYLTGTLTNGQIVANADEPITLYLDNVNITCQTGACIVMFGKEDKTVTLASSSTNTITDAKEYTNTYDNGEEVNAALFCKNDLIINGDGSLTINSNFNNAIGCKDELTIQTCKLDISSVNNAVKGNESISLNGCQIDISTNEDGLKSDSEEDGLGNIDISDSNLSIKSTGDAIQASGNLSVNGGTYNISTGNNAFDKSNKTSDDSSTNTNNNNNSSSNDQKMRGNFFPGFFDDFNQDSSNNSGTSSKGVKAVGDIVISNGDFTFNCSDDAIHSDSNITIDNGTFDITTTDDGVHANNKMTYNNGTLVINESYEGLEATSLTINDGDITIYAEDDCINCAEYGAVAQVDVANENCYLTIEGGTIHAYVTTAAEGDGLDSNGYININGGSVFVEASYSGPDSALDADGAIYVSGGTVVAIGSPGRGEMPSEESKQCSLYYGANSDYSSQTTLELTDSSGNSIIEYTSKQPYSAIIVSSPKITKNNTYNLNVKGSEVASFTPSSGITKQGSSSSGGGSFRPW